MSSVSRIGQEVVHRARFLERCRVRLILALLAVAILVVSGFGLWRSTSLAVESQTPVFEYEHQGTFGYHVFVVPGILYSEEFDLSERDETGEDGVQVAEAPPLVFFREILEDLDLAFTYDFAPRSGVSALSTVATVTVVAEDAGLWRREMSRFEEHTSSSSGRLEFPFDIDSLEARIERIEDEIGVPAYDCQFEIIAEVQTTGEDADGEPFEARLVHTLTALLNDTLLEFEGELGREENGAEGALEWKCSGRFDYEAQLEYNELYGTTMVRSEPLPVAEDWRVDAAPGNTPLERLSPGGTYFPKLIDHIDGRFEYDFVCDRPTNSETATVRIMAFLEKPDRWSKELEVVPTTPIEAGSAVSFPVDVEYFDRVVDAIEEQIGEQTGAYRFELRAVVDIRAETSAGTIDETYVHGLEGVRSGNSLTFDEKLSKVQSGVLELPVQQSTGEDGGWRVPSIVGVLFGSLTLGLLGVLQVRASNRPDMNVETVRSRYKKTLVGVDELPPMRPTDVIVPVSSIDALAKASDESLKPFLHCEKDGVHIYCVIDGNIRYQYTFPTE